MAKGYWVAHVTVTNPDIYKEYVAANGVAFKKFGGKFLVRGGKFEAPAGKLRERHVVIEFESFAVAKACYDSPEYKTAMAFRDRGGTADVVIVEGYEG